MRGIHPYPENVIEPKTAVAQDDVPLEVHANLKGSTRVGDRPLPPSPLLLGTRSGDFSEKREFLANRSRAAHVNEGRAFPQRGPRCRSRVAPLERGGTKGNATFHSPMDSVMKIFGFR